MNALLCKLTTRRVYNQLLRPGLEPRVQSTRSILALRSHLWLSTIAALLLLRLCLHLGTTREAVRPRDPAQTNRTAATYRQILLSHGLLEVCLLNLLIPVAG
jgi:cytochrome b561